MFQPYSVSPSGPCLHISPLPAHILWGTSPLAPSVTLRVNTVSPSTVRSCCCAPRSARGAAGCRSAQVNLTCPQVQTLTGHHCQRWRSVDFKVLPPDEALPPGASVVISTLVGVASAALLLALLGLCFLCAARFRKRGEARVDGVQYHPACSVPLPPHCRDA